MLPETLPLLPAFLGPAMFLVAGLFLIVVILVVARFILSLAWKLVVIGAIVLLVLWLLGLVQFGAGPL
jgi:hypothetical protein